MPGKYWLGRKSEHFSVPRCTTWDVDDIPLEDSSSAAIWVQRTEVRLRTAVHHAAVLLFMKIRGTVQEVWRLVENDANLDVGVCHQTPLLRIRTVHVSQRNKLGEKYVRKIKWDKAKEKLQLDQFSI
jgi:hypothetical protein